MIKSIFPEFDEQKFFQYGCNCQFINYESKFSDISILMSFNSAEPDKKILARRHLRAYLRVSENAHRMLHNH